MTRYDYLSMVRKFGPLYLLAFFGTAIPLLGLGLYAAHRVSETQNWLGRELGDLVGPDLVRPVVFLFFAPVLCAPFILAAWALDRVDRRIGCRCPRCARSLLLRCDPGRIAHCGVCPSCGNSAFDDLHGPDARPSE